MDRNEELRILLEDNHDGHRGRLRRRVRLAGMESLKPHEALEFLLNYIIPRQDVTELAHALIESFGTVENVLFADTCALMKVKGMGRKAALWLGLLGEATEAFAYLQLDDGIILDTGLKSLCFGFELQEEIKAPSTWQLCLNRDYQLIYCREICPSTAWGETLYIRDALSDVLHTRAKYVILIQFLGVFFPKIEKYDIKHLRRYGKTLQSAGCQLVDVMLLNEFYYCMSLWEEGKIPNFKSSSAFARRLRNVSEDTPPYQHNLKENIKQTKE